MYRVYHQKHVTVTDNVPVIIYEIQIESKTTFRIKTGYYLELLMSETMKLLGKTKNKITKDEVGENVPCLETTEVVLVHWNIINNDYQHDQESLFLIKRLINC